MWRLVETPNGSSALTSLTARPVGSLKWPGKTALPLRPLISVGLSEAQVITVMRQQLNHRHSSSGVSGGRPKNQTHGSRSERFRASCHK